MRTHHRRDGFALAMTLILTLVLTGGVITALNQVSSERMRADSESAGLDAYTLAEAGLQQVLESWSGSSAPPVDGDSARLDLANGYADVVIREILPALGDASALYVIRSRGTHVQGGWGGAPEAVRTVAQLATWTKGDMNVRAGWVGLNGLQKNGTSGKLSGTDACIADQEDTVAGVSIPATPGYIQNGGTPEEVLVGDPPLDTLAGSPGQAADSIDIDWDGIVSGKALTVDYTIPPDPWPEFPEGEWPIIYINNPGGSFTLPAAGRGTLIVRGDLVANGSHMWEGIIMVGGKLTLSGSTTVEGAALSGLNVKLGETTDPSEAGDESDTASGNVTVQFHSCNVESALQRFAGFQVLDNTWVDNWAMY